MNHSSSKAYFTDDNGVYAAKNLMRSAVKTAKATLTPSFKAQQAKAVFDTIEQTPEFRQAKTILMYWSMPDELPTHQWVKKWSRSKKILLPVINNKQLIVGQFTTETKLVRGVLNLMEPPIEIPEKIGLTSDDAEQIDLAIIPGVAFDKQKNRLGRGKAYYDNFLQDKSMLKWAVGFDIQLYDNIPATAMDIKMDRIITPNLTVS